MSFLKTHLSLTAGVLLGFAVLLLVIFVRPSSVFPTPPASKTSPTTKKTPTLITWTPPSVSEVISPGDTKTVLVSFTSSRNVRRATVEISPELTPLVRVNPALLERIRKGESRQVQLVFSAAATYTLGTVSGTIQLRKGKKEKGDKPEDDDEDDEPEGKLFTQPLPVTVKVWAVFKDTDSGLKILYPPMYQIKNLPSAQGPTVEMWESQQNFKENLPSSFTVTVQIINLHGESLESFVTRKLDPPFYINGSTLGFLEVFEPGEGDGLFHHFIYFTEKHVLIDATARTVNHDSDPDFLDILQGLAF